MTNRIACAALRSRITDADTAAALIRPRETVAASGFTGSGYPKMVPQALARRMAVERAAGRPFRVNLWTGASTGPELDGALAAVDGIAQRLPYSADPVAREKINRGEIDYLDMHLSQVAPMAWEGVLGPLDTAIVEVTGIRSDGSLIPSSSVGNNKTWLDRAQRVILEVNRWQDPALEGMHDIYYGTPCHRIACRSRWFAPTIASGRHTLRAIPTRSSRSSKPMRQTATCLSLRPTKPRAPSPDISSSF
jgi:succinyl-CoA:acetate CoA-transferase